MALIDPQVTQRLLRVLSATQGSFALTCDDAVGVWCAAVDNRHGYFAATALTEQGAIESLLECLGEKGKAMSKNGPWRIEAEQVQAAPDEWLASLVLDGERVQTHTSVTLDGAVDGVKDGWRRQMGEHYADQDFVVVALGHDESQAVAEDGDEGVEWRDA